MKIVVLIMTIGLAGYASGSGGLLRETAAWWADAPWTPEYITTAAWYDASDTNTITQSAGLVSQWDDKSGNSYHVTQSTDRWKPTTGVRTIGGLNALCFTLSTDDLPQRLSNTNLVLSTPYSVMAVAVADRIDSTIMDSAVTATRSTLRHRGVVFKIGIFAGAWLDASATIAVNDTVLSAAVFNGAASQVSSDGDEPVVGNTGAGYLNGLRFGCVANESKAGYMDGPIGEMVIVSGEWTVKTRQKLEGYLAHKWGIETQLPTNHPYYASAPTKLGDPD